MAFLSMAAADVVPADNHQPPPLPPLKMDGLLDRTWGAQAWAETVPGVMGVRGPAPWAGL